MRKICKLQDVDIFIVTLRKETKDKQYGEEGEKIGKIREKHTTPQNRTKQKPDNYAGLSNFLLMLSI